jgi:hypothetical protein
MPRRKTTEPDPAPESNYDPAADPPLVTDADDPGGAHRKGYVADPGPAREAPETDPVPLAKDSEVKGHVRNPDEGDLPPTGRSEPQPYTENDRLMGSDR